MAPPKRREPDEDSRPLGLSRSNQLGNKLDGLRRRLPQEMSAGLTLAEIAALCVANSRLLRRGARP
jgi:hypothetical protein